MSEAQMRRIHFLRSIVKSREAEIDRLRAALEQIIKLDDEWVPEAQDDYTYTGYQVCADVARSALNPAKD